MALLWCTHERAGETGGGKKFVLREVASAKPKKPKSNAFFFYSHDIRFLVKTVSIEEKRQMIAMLPEYTRHLAEQPGSTVACRGSLTQRRTRRRRACRRPIPTAVRRAPPGGGAARTRRRGCWGGGVARSSSR